MAISDELEAKLERVRAALARHGLGAARLRGVDWFAWITAGGSNVVILTTESGVAEVLVTAQSAWVLTDSIEELRLRDEEVPAGLEVWAAPWNTPAAREAFVATQVGGIVASDRPLSGEAPLPSEVVAAKRRLLPEEVERYRALGRDASEAMSEVLRRCQPVWSELRLAEAGAEALWRRGIHPTLTLAGGGRRLARYRHLTPTPEPIGERAMLVFCGRRYGLYANLTRFVSFRPPTDQERSLAHDVALIEADAWAASNPGATIGAVYDAIVAAYARLGHAGSELLLHQGGTTGYLSREVVGRPGVETIIEPSTALAWNPSLAATKIEDTALTTPAGIEILTADPTWPSTTVAGRPRPQVLVRA